jgi:hypothetical protein
MFTDEEDLNLCYNRHEKKFDSLHFEIIAEDLKKHFFIGKIEEKIYSILFKKIMNIDPNKRLFATNCLKYLKNKLAPKVLKELESRRMNMGWSKIDYEHLKQNDEKSDSIENYVSSDEVIVSFQNSQIEGVEKVQHNQEFNLNIIKEENDSDSANNKNEITNLPKSLKSVNSGKKENDDLIDLLGSIDQIKRISLGNIEESEYNEFETNSSSSDMTGNTFESNVGLEPSQKHIEHPSINEKKEIDSFYNSKMSPRISPNGTGQIV